MLRFIRASLFAVAAVFLVFISSCESKSRSPEPSASDSAEAVAPQPLPGGQVSEPVPVPRGVSEPYVDRGVCPFECCTYTEWRAKEELAVYARERDTTQVAFTIPAGERFTGLTGNVHLDQVGIAAVRDTFTTFGEDGAMQFAPGDTVYVLSHIGEGHFNVVHEGRKTEVEGFWSDYSVYGRPDAPGVLIREPRPQWWAQIRDRQGRTGWLFMDRIGGKVGNVDACGGPDV